MPLVCIERALLIASKRELSSNFMIYKLNLNDTYKFKSSIALQYIELRRIVSYQVLLIYNISSLKYLHIKQAS